MSLFKKTPPIQRREMFAGLDIGASKICCAIAKVENRPSNSTSSYSSFSDSTLKIVGIGCQVSKGIKGGAVVDLESLEDSILSAVQNAEQTAARNIDHVYVSLPSVVTRSKIIRSKIQLSGTVVEENHLKRLLNLNYDEITNNEWQIIHILPLSYSIDSAGHIRDPRGMVGEVLSVDLQVIMAPINLIRNLSSCIGRCHLDVAGYVCAGYASGLATLVEDELELGVSVIDMGGSQTTIASFIEGNLVGISTIPFGGNNITNDIARGLGTAIAHAERTKNLYGTLMPSSSADREVIPVHAMGENDHTPHNQVSKSVLTHIIRARVEEIFELIVKKMNNSGVNPLAYQRIVLTGGASQLQGLREIATNLLFTKQIRVGLAINVQGTFDMVKNPSFSTCAGVLHYGLQKYKDEQLGEVRLRKWDFFGQMTGWLRKNL